MKGMARDYTMARLAAARVQTQNAADLVDVALTHFVEGEDDGGDERAATLEAAELAARELVESLEMARSGLAQMTDDELAILESDAIVEGADEDDEDDEDDEE